MDVAVRPNAFGQMQIAPLTGDNKGLRRAEIRQGVREVILCKDQDGKMGLRVRSVNKVNITSLFLNLKVFLCCKLSWRERHC